MSNHENSEEAPPRAENVEWGYEAENGPDVWNCLSTDFLLCSEGTHQSPIDLANPKAARLPAIAFNYRPEHPQQRPHHRSGLLRRELDRGRRRKV